MLPPGSRNFGNGTKRKKRIRETEKCMRENEKWIRESERWIREYIFLEFLNLCETFRESDNNRLLSLEPEKIIVSTDCIAFLDGHIFRKGPEDLD